MRKASIVSGMATLVVVVVCGSVMLRLPRFTCLILLLLLLLLAMEWFDTQAARRTSDERRMRGKIE
jgi:hypothetical protein